MAMKLSSYLCLRSELLPSLRRGEGICLSRKDKKRLAEILNETDDLRSCSEMGFDNRPLVGPCFVFLSGFAEVIERSKNRERSRQLFEEIHQIIMGYHVGPSIYRNLRGAFEELNIKPSDDLRNAANFFARKYAEQNFPPDKKIYCWKDCRKGYPANILPPGQQL